MPFGRLALLEDPVDQDLPLLHLVLPEERRAEHVGVGEVLGELGVPRRQQVDDVLVSVQLEQAVGEQQRRLLVGGIRLQHGLELGNPLLGAPGLVEREREVQADGRVVPAGKRLPVLLDAFAEAAEPDERGTQVRTDVGAVGRDVERDLVVLHRPHQVTGLVRDDRARQQVVDLLVVGGRRLLC